ncbi:carbohydrate ABC transporter membrane protein 1, CUT1 family [Anaerocolumna jejuensis DSM 15929]|uniref:Carbohydrate ABC transporter membrane protein 1, CUT1 family n=1 Tax=Anaerocolumna jejuensis DSM 15929 TaxID=1121322 RepID=A0A1M6UCY5_9FIRM|nr:ABC transporter permease subunit [Anaerocolumna jejuensis]SHK67033.1 carbohydrate ABC transporter membrane protein 1, CUT1 family [Anaerocolumna jejuensis DSM 15929]
MAKLTAEAKRKERGWGRKKKTLLLLSMVAPGAIWLILLRYLPMFGIIIAFKNYKIYTKEPTLLNNVMHSKWVGLENFKFMFKTTDSWIMIRNTLGYNLLWILLGIVVAVSFAIMLDQITNKFVAKSYQTMMFFPYFLSWVVASYFVLAFLDPTRGLIVHFQKSHGMDVINWYNDTTYWPFILTIANMWKYIGYSTILYLAAITGIDTTQYEAAGIDGASKWQQIRYVTIPHLKTMIIILFILNIGKIFNADFGLFYSVPMNSGPLFPVTQVFDTYIYRTLMATHNEGMSTAASLMQNFVNFIFIMTANTIVRKVDEESSLF